MGIPKSNQRVIGAIL